MTVTELLAKLIACPSVTPKDEGAQILLAEFLSGMGFTCTHLPFGDVPNLFARIGTGAPHLCYAGHTDVVPPGDEQKWTHGPFNPAIKDGIIYGRGASDMKGSIAAMAIAARNVLARGGIQGSLSFLITGDEEGPAIDGTVRVLDWMKAQGHIPDMALVGEPTNPTELGQEIKIGRRGSLTGMLMVRGKQGHVGYPHLADNPLPRLIALAGALAAHRFDNGTEFFQPTNLEIVSIDVGNPADNIIPAAGRARFNVRFNDRWSGESLSSKIHEILKSTGLAYELELSCGAESFLTQPSVWTQTVRAAVQDVTGKDPAYTTNGGTSDARFIVNFCPVVEYGAVNESVHQVNEHARIEHLEGLVKIYEQILERTLR
jgi:succinyl-diaminopimelate desuccinylase